MTYSSSHVAVLDYCPECGKELERHPISLRKACFLHGDFVPKGDDLIWRPTKGVISRESQ